MADVDTRLFDVLPDTGIYCTVRAAKSTVDGRDIKIPEWHASKDALAQHLAVWGDRTDTHYAFGSFRQMPAGDKHRSREQVLAIRSVAIDVDVKPVPTSKQIGRYHVSKADAEVNLLNTVRAGHIPRPSFIVESANGYHVYWVFDRDITPASWQDIADALVDRLRIHAPKLIADPTTTRGAERILRWPGTVHQKKDKPRYLVTLVADTGERYAPEAYAQLVGTTFNPNAIDRSTPHRGSTRRPPPVPGAVPMSIPLMATSKIPMDQPLETIRRCGAMIELERRVSEDYATYQQTGDEGTKYDLTEPAWLATLSVLKFFGTRGEKYARTLSEMSQKYDADVFDSKWQHVQHGINTYGCEKFCRELDLDTNPRVFCTGCPAFKPVTGKGDPCPADLAQYEAAYTPPPVQFLATSGIPWVPIDVAINVSKPDPHVLHYASPTIHAPQQPDADTPKYFWHMMNGELTVVIDVPIKGATGKEPKTERKLIRILRRTAWPIAKQIAAGEDGLNEYTYLYGACKKEDHKPEELYEFTLTPAEEADDRTMAKALTKRGVEVIGGVGSMPHIRRFFSNVKDRTGDTVQHLQNSMGWTEDNTFNIGNLLLTPQGPRHARYHQADNTTITRFARCGDPQVQLNAFTYMYGMADDNTKVFALGCIAAPFFSLLSGVGENTNPIVNLAGEPNTGKTLALGFAQSVWGAPVLDQLTETSTSKSMERMFSRHRHLPTIFDEVSNFRDKDALTALITTFAQGVPRKALTVEGTERGGTSPWSSALLCASNQSLHEFLQGQSTVGGDTMVGKMRRILEVPVYRPLFGPNDPGIDSARDTLKSNYGFIGPTVMQYAVQHYAEVRDMMYAARDVEKQGMGDDNTGSFYVTFLAGVRVAADLLYSLGIMDVDPSWLERASASFKLASMQKLADARARTDDILTTVRNVWEGFTYKFRIDRTNNEIPLGNDLNKLARMGSGHGVHARIRYVEDHSGPNIVERIYLHRGEFEAYLRRSSLSLDSIIRRWQNVGYRVRYGEQIIDSGAAPTLALGTGGPTATIFGVKAVPCVIVEIDTGVASPG